MSDRRIVRANFCDTINHAWVVEFNDGGIGVPLFDVEEDVRYFEKAARQAGREEAYEKVLAWAQIALGQADLENLIATIKEAKR